MRLSELITVLTEELAEGIDYEVKGFNLSSHINYDVVGIAPNAGKQLLIKLEVL